MQKRQRKEVELILDRKVQMSKTHRMEYSKGQNNIQPESAKVKFTYNDDFGGQNGIFFKFQRSKDIWRNVQKTKS